MAQENIPKNQVRSRNSIEQREHEDDAAARRVLPVDEQGNPINSDNRLPVDALVNISSGADIPEIFNVTAPIANTEYSQLLPIKTRHLLIKVRDNDAIMRIAFESGDTDVKWVTIGLGNTFFIGDVELTGRTVYFQTNKSNKVVEILAWS